MRYKVMYNLYKYAGTHVRRDNADGVTFRKLPPRPSENGTLRHITVGRAAIATPPEPI